MNRFDRLNQMMEEKRWDWLVVSSPHLIQYLTGIVPEIEAGPSPFEPGPKILSIERSGKELKGRLLCPEEVKESIQSPWIEAITYVSYDIHTNSYDRQKEYRNAFEKWSFKSKNKIRIGIEEGYVPFIMHEFLGNNQFDDCTPEFNKIRRIKDEDELQALKAATQLANIGQRAVKKIVKENLTEIEMFGSIKAEIEKAAGKRIPLLADFVSGPLTAEIGGPPSSRKIRKGELLLADLAPCLNGYWGDSCTVTSVGTASKRVLDVLDLLKETLNTTKKCIRAGVPVKEIDQIVRGKLSKYGFTYPHHTGHGLGIQFHEAPLISANGTDTFEENMVIAIEPGVYLADEAFGTRLEEVGRITKDGFEQWTDCELDI